MTDVEVGWEHEGAGGSEACDMAVECAADVRVGGLVGVMQVNNDRSRDYTNPGIPPNQVPVLGQAPGVGLDGQHAGAAGGGPGYPAAQYGAGPPPGDSGAQQQAWEPEGSGKAQQVSGPMGGQPMAGQPPMYMSHQQHGAHHGPPGAPGSYQGPPGPVTSMGPMGGPPMGGPPMGGPPMGGPMGPPGHMGPGMHPQGQQNHHMGPPGHPMTPYQQMHGPGHQGMGPSNGGPGGYYM